MGFRKAVGFSKPSRGPMSLRGAHRNNAERSAYEAKKHFFWRSHHNSDKTAAFSPSVLEFTKPEIRNICAGPGPTFGSRRPWLCHQDKTSGISREMQKVNHLKFLQTKKLQ